MYALEQPLVRRQVSLLDGTPWGAIAALALVVAVVVVLSLLGLVPRATVGVVGTAAAHGTLLGVALAWTSVGERRDRHAVLEAAVIGKQDAEGLTKTKAFVVLKDGQAATPEELQAFVKERLAPFKYPRFVEFLRELPKTATGKIQRYRLREREAQA